MRAEVPKNPRLLGTQTARERSAAVLGLILLASGLAAGIAAAQTRVDGAFPFESDPAKKYSLYIPSGYEEGTPHRLMIGFHPLNTARWDAESWCDTLLVFAEQNDLLLACPDGGPDGRVDDPIDFAFTHALLDSVSAWYSVDAAKVYAMGFSWGGRATYEFGLMNPGIFGGFVPIGAAITGTNEVQDIIENATGKPFYIVHGANDIPNTRFFPIRQALIDNGAFVESLLMTGVGHTIDFPNRNEILGTAFQWVDSVNCVLDPSGVEDSEGGGAEIRQESLGGGAVDALALAGNPAPAGGEFLVLLARTFAHPDPLATRSVELFDLGGRRLEGWRLQGLEFALRAPAVRGSYFLRVTGPEGVALGKVVVE
jgi:predicted esterase